MNDLQQKEFDLLKCFDSVCKELNITYFLVCGSALGAVKYKGFIPWDDDVDIGMFRKDYDVFLSEAPKILPEKYFLQNSRSDPYASIIYSKLRDSQTTYIEKASASLHMNHGIYIDIFPLDGYPAAKIKQFLLEFKKKICIHLIRTSFDIPRRGLANLEWKLLRLIGVQNHTAWLVNCLQKELSKYSIESSKIICNHGNWQGRLEYADKSQYGDGIWSEFEGMRVRIPADYDAYLSQKYGEWKSDPPLCEQIGHHDYEILDCSIGYKQYVSYHAN